MQITIKTKNLDLTPSLQEWVDEKIGALEKFIERFETEGQILCEVEVARTTNHHHKGDVFYAEANLHMPGRKIRAEAQDFDVRVAVDRVRDRLQSDLVKHKEKAGLTGKAMRHMMRMGTSAYKAAQKILWWRNK